MFSGTFAPSRRTAEDSTVEPADDPQDRGDSETQIQRLIFAPAARSYTPQAWVYPAVSTPENRWAKMRFAR